MTEPYALICRLRTTDSQADPQLLADAVQLMVEMTVDNLSMSLEIARLRADLRRATQKGESK